MRYMRLLGERYTPLYFLNALIAGGFALAAYMYIYWLCKLSFASIPTFETLRTLLTAETWGLKIAIIPLICAFLFFAYLHVRLFIWNYKNFVVWRGMIPFKALMTAKDKTVLLTIPATISVSVVILFAAFLMFVPYISTIQDYMFPFVILGLLYITGRSVRLYGELLTASMTNTTPSPGLPGSPIGQLLTVFAFILLALPFALIAQNSNEQITILVSALAAYFLLAFAGILLLFRFVSQFRHLFQGTLAAETAPLHWFAGGILCIGTVVLFQLDGGISRLFRLYPDASFIFLASGALCFLTSFLAYTGYVALKRHDVLEPLLAGKLYAPSFYAVFCPILGLGFIYSYFVNIVLYQAGVSDPDSFVGCALHAPILLLYGWAAMRMMRINKKSLGGQQISNKG